MTDAAGVTFSRYMVFAASEDGENIGYVTCDDSPGHVFLQELYVHPAWRGRGIARSLIEQALAFYRGREVRLKAEPYEKPEYPAAMPVDVARLRRFYQSLGFEARGIDLMIRSAGD